MIEESQTLAEELARASAIESLPPMLQALMRAALGELQAWQEGRSTRGLTVARHAVAEWRRWLATR
jgi:hypothetical protein